MLLRFQSRRPGFRLCDHLLLVAMNRQGLRGFSPVDRDLGFATKARDIKRRVSTLFQSRRPGFRLCDKSGRSDNEGTDKFQSRRPGFRLCDLALDSAKGSKDRFSPVDRDLGFATLVTLHVSGFSIRVSVP